MSTSWIKAFRGRACRWSTVRYLTGRDAFSSWQATTLSVLMMLVWLAVVIIAAANHEMWRDEVRALTIAMEPETIWGLPAALKSEGHPLIWYVILRVCMQVFRTPLVLPIASITIVLIAIVVFIRFSPFLNWQKVLFVFGVFSVHEYSVVARNYGIAMLFFFVFAALYRDRKRHPMLIGLTLALLANTNVHACIMAAVLGAYWLSDLVINDRVHKEGRRVILWSVGGVTCAVLGGLLATAISAPGDSGLVRELSVSDLPMAIFSSLFTPGDRLRGLCYLVPAWVRTVVVLTFVFGLLKHRRAMIAALTGLLCYGVFVRTVYPGYFRHQGMLVVFFFVLLWITQARATDKREKRMSWKSILDYGMRNVLVGAVLAWFAVYGAYRVYVDFRWQLSSSKRFGADLQSSHKFRHAILVGMPTFYLEAVPYYADNEIFLPYEKRFAKRADWTSPRKRRLTLMDLLVTSQNLQEETGRTVLIVLGRSLPKEIEEDEPLRFYTLHITNEDLARFNEATRLVRVYSAARGENYWVHSLREIQSDTQ